jgi:ribokinase
MTLPASAGHAPEIVVLGSINMDQVFRTAVLPARGETVAGSGMRYEPGGKGANQAVAAARQQARVAMIACVGVDEHGRTLTRKLAEDGIDISQVRTCAAAVTGVAAILVSDAGDNSIVVIGGANQRLNASDIDSAQPLIARAGVLICQLESPPAVVAHAMRVARACGVLTVFNPAPAHAMLAELMALADVLIVNESEAAQLSGLTVATTIQARAAAQVLLSMGPAQVIVTLGGAGLLLAEPGSIRHLAAPAVNVVDTTAAGDTFVGAFAAALVRGETLDEAAASAQYAAALTVTRHGAQSAIPGLREVEQFRRTAALQTGSQAPVKSAAD